MRVAVLLVVLLAGCGSPAYVGEPDQRASYEQALAAESFFVANLGLSQASHVRVEVQVVEGGPIDVWLAEDCRRFTDGELRFLDRAMGVTNATLEADVAAGGCVPLDNAGGGLGQTTPAGAARVNYTISVWRR